MKGDRLTLKDEDLVGKQTGRKASSILSHFAINRDTYQPGGKCLFERHLRFAMNVHLG